MAGKAKGNGGAMLSRPDGSQMERELHESNEAIKLCELAIQEQEMHILNHRRAMERHTELLKRQQYERQDLQIQRDSLLKRMEVFRQYKRGADLTPLEGAPPSKKTAPSSPEPSRDVRGTRSSSSTAIAPSPPPTTAPPSPMPQTPRTPRHSANDVTVVSGPVRPRVVPLETTSSADAGSSSRRSGSSSRYPDRFWSTTDKCKILGQPRTTLVPDQCDRKVRCSAFHANLPDILATTSDEGMLRLWHYQPTRRTLSPISCVPSTTLRKTNACVEGLAWNSTRSKLAMAFRDPIHDKGGICIAEWDSDAKIHLPPTTVWQADTSLHPKGVSCIGWLDEAYFVTGGAKHKVVCWNHATRQVQTLHQHHRSEIRAVCPHSSGNAVFSGALDGVVAKFDLHTQTVSVVREWRKPVISKINAIAEHPANPHLLMYSCVNPGNQVMMFHDLRQRSNDNMPSMVWHKLQNKAMSQHITPRWSSAGMHVSCGSTVGDLFIWDLRACRRVEPPHQTVSMHQAKVLHGLWHATQNAIVTVSHDRNLGVVTFQ
ncbi:hypothetical protein H310_13170 [Aphanomyces invadans]|uniref:Uncharacterized protein n=1 Tax=Aphanomyces invadans TaxID=157072 RepID=A0A024TFW8_9STRA|nr:hypothetical protein H310_13170 [Aphanomyces invadans]ETV92481.1 hypothetical protein H310_13170 [Aphanomyces invadans]|eukprot:XP_008878788.1 hypothetical protein H310_13170 [Aphanomyces invadans]